MQGLLLALHQWYYLYYDRTQKKWETELKARNIDWKVKFNNIGKICHENKYEKSKEVTP